MGEIPKYLKIQYIFPKTNRSKKKKHGKLENSLSRAKIKIQPAKSFGNFSLPKLFETLRMHLGII